MQIRTGASREGAKFKSKQNIDAKLEDTFQISYFAEIMRSIVAIFCHLVI
jgi:hypothetical protein